MVLLTGLLAGQPPQYISASHLKPKPLAPKLSKPHPKTPYLPNTRSPPRETRSVLVAGPNIQVSPT